MSRIHRRTAFKPLADAPLADAAAERARREHHEAIGELQKAEAIGGRLFKGIVLTPQVVFPIRHGFGRRASVFVSPPRRTLETGWIVERELAKFNTAEYALLLALGYTAPLTVDVWVL